MKLNQRQIDLMKWLLEQEEDEINLNLREEEKGPKDPESRERIEGLFQNLFAIKRLKGQLKAEELQHQVN